MKHAILPLILDRIGGRLRQGSLHVVLPDGTARDYAGPAPSSCAELRLHRWRLLRRLLLGGHVAFGEAYVDGDWSSPDPVALLELAANNDTALGAANDGSLPARLFDWIAHRRHANTRRGSRRNVVAHYDLGNAFYAQWLDRGMSYSSALYRRPDMSLEAAQAAKQDRVLDLLELPGRNSRILEIGCGWGGLARRLAERGAQVTGLTLSPAQRDYAQNTLADQNVRADIRIQDYRETTGRFDRIVSIEMLEAVGEAYWPLYFARLRALLKPGGIAVLQSITIAEDRFAGYRRRPDFIQRYVFPGGMLPTPTIIADQVARAGMTVGATESFGPSYARTLAEWRGRFHAAWPAIAAQGFSERFRRLWDYYLAYCEAGFRTGAISVGLWQIRV